MRYEETLGRLRQLAKTLPETSELITHGNPTFKAGKKTFAVIERHQHSVEDRYLDVPALSFKVEREFQQLLCQDDNYFVAPYVGRHGWTCVVLESVKEWDEIEDLVMESYRSAALKRMLKVLDGE